MPTRKLAVPLAAATLLILPAAASADFVHVVAPGESLTSVAAVDGLTVAQLAAANGLPSTAELVAGAQLLIPPQSGGSTTEVANTTEVSTSTASDGDADADDEMRDGAPATEAASVSAESPSTASAATSQPVGAAAEGAPGGPPYPTSESVSPEEIASVAAADGVPSSLATAIAYMESGFNNAFTSSANARGVMQITPGTWSWIDRELAGSTPLEPSSALGNVRAGVLLLRSLLDATGGDQTLAIAGYYQGLPSVLQNGMYPSTQQYVADVQALEQRF